MWCYIRLCWITGLHYIWYPAEHSERISGSRIFGQFDSAQPSVRSEPRSYYLLPSTTFCLMKPLRVCVSLVPTSIVSHDCKNNTAANLFQIVLKSLYIAKMLILLQKACTQPKCYKNVNTVTMGFKCGIKHLPFTFKKIYFQLETFVLWKTIQTNQTTVIDSRQILDQPFVIRAHGFLNI